MELYIHLPFCKSKCYYCNFNSFPCSDEDIISAYVDAIKKEIYLASKKFPNAKIKTIYIGGGTPSYIDTKYIKDIIETTVRCFKITYLNEFTIECNPESIDKSKIDPYQKLGINRISMGIQSLNNDNLKVIGRLHDADVALNKLDLIEDNFQNFSTDLIIGLPFDTLESVHYEVDLLSKRCPHLSMYELQLEQGTKLFDQVEKHQITIPDDDTVVDLFEEAYKTCYKNGLVRYEVSNFSRPYYEAIHNSGYWKREEYLGFGAGASSLIKTVDGKTPLIKEIRFSTGNLVNPYIISVNKAETYSDISRINVELLDEDKQDYEKIILGLRTKWGVDSKLVVKNLNKHPELKKYFKIKNNVASLTNDGLQIMNYLLCELF